jgi:hypothetical protein
LASSTTEIPSGSGILKSSHLIEVICNETSSNKRDDKRTPS